MARSFYHENPERLVLETEVIDARPGRVLLAQSPFYPGGGGQLADRGTLRWQGGAHVAASGISRIELAPVLPGYPTEYSLALRQVWVRQASQSGAIVVRYDPRGCRTADVYARDGATLPSV